MGNHRRTLGSLNIALLVAIDLPAGDLKGPKHLERECQHPTMFPPLHINALVTYSLGKQGGLTYTEARTIEI